MLCLGRAFVFSFFFFFRFDLLISGDLVIGYCSHTMAVNGVFECFTHS